MNAVLPRNAVCVSVLPLQDGAVLPADALHSPACCLDVEAPCAPHRHPSDMGSSLLALCHNRLDDVARLEAVVGLLLREGFPLGKP